MPIRDSNLPVLMHLLAADLNCQQIEKSEVRLRRAAAHWKAISQGVDDGGTYPPIDIAADCTVCLASAAAISRTLFLGDRKGKRAVHASSRTRVLAALLRLPSLPIMESLSVRHSWEHLDERLDEIMTEGTFKSVSEIHVSVQQPDAQTFVLRLFDPVMLEIGYGPDRISLEALSAEGKEVRARVKLAIQTLNSQKILLYGVAGDAA